MTDDLAELIDELRMIVRPAERPASPWLDARGVAERLHLSPKTVQNMTGPNADDSIPFHRLSVGGEKRFHLEEVDEWLRGH